MTTSPDWVFGLLLASGGVAMLSGMVWVLFLPGLITGPPRPQPRWSWSRAGWGRAWLVFPVALIAYNLYINYRQDGYRQMWTQSPDRYFSAAFVGFGALIVGGLIVASRRHLTTGVWPSGRRAPWGLFWVLPVIFSAAVIGGAWALITMVSSMVPTTPHC
jgi:hypothetical protein